MSNADALRLHDSAIAAYHAVLLSKTATQAQRDAALLAYQRACDQLERNYHNEDAP